MAPRKEKTERASADQSVELILNYLRKQNRPYSAADISSNLHNKVTKAAATKYLKDMHERKEIEGRASGKQIVYHTVQNPDDAPTPEDLAAMDAEIQSLRDETTAARAEEKALKASLATTNATLSTTDLRASVNSLECEKTEITIRLQSLRSGSVKPLNAEEKRVVEMEWQKWKRTADARRKICVGLWKEIRDGYLPEGVDERELGERFGFDY